MQTLQQSMLELVRQRSEGQHSDDYIATVAASGHIVLVRKIALWWRRMQICNFSRLTSALLLSRNKLDQEITDFMRLCSYSAFNEEIGIQFLEFVSAHSKDELLNAIATFELAMIKIKMGAKIECEIPICCEPYELIEGLLKNNLDEEKLTMQKHIIMVSYLRVDLFTAEPDDFAGSRAIRF